MRTFVAQCAVFLGLQALILLALEPSYRRRFVDQDFLAAWNDKRTQLEGLEAPRVILVGGSNLAFGVDSPALRRELGRPVVNLGLNAGMGRELILRQVEAEVRAGDVVVLSLEYNLFAADDAPRSAAMMLMLLDAAPEAARYVPVRQWGALLDGGLGHLARRPRLMAHLWLMGSSAQTGVYTRSSFNHSGDVVAHRRQAGSMPATAHLSPPRDLGEMHAAIDRLNRFAARLRAAGARVFITAAPIPEDDLVRQRAGFDAFWALMGNELHIESLEPRLLAFPRAEFYDTVYHLGLEATRQRTAHLAGALQRALGRAETQR